MDAPLARFIATGFFSGLTPRAPGTVGSVVFLLIWWGVTSLFPSVALLIGVALVLVTSLAGVMASSRYLLSLEHSTTDPQEIVIDEWAGLAIALLPALEAGTPIWSPLAAFALFRFFDIVKPGLIGRAEALPRAWGIMADDILAGIASAVLLFFLLLAL